MFKDIELFGQAVAIKAAACSLNGNPGGTYDTPYINLYVRLTNICQADCPFCEFRGIDPHPFDVKKFKKMLTDVTKQVAIKKVSFTGGEPSLNMKTFTACVKAVKIKNKNIFTVINTNGVHLAKLDNIMEHIDSVALSRHHYIDEVNAELFGMRVSPTTNDTIKNFKNKHKLHLSCNLVNGFIDDTDACYDYIDFYSKLGIEDFGFVSLMKINEYAKTHHVDFETAKLECMPNTINSKQYRLGDSCKCNNYLVLNRDGDLSYLYARCVVDTKKCFGMLVYDNGVLKVGFTGPVLHDYNS